MTPREELLALRRLKELEAKAGGSAAPAVAVPDPVVPAPKADFSGVTSEVASTAPKSNMADSSRGGLITDTSAKVLSTTLGGILAPLFDMASPDAAPGNFLERASTRIQKGAVGAANNYAGATNWLSEQMPDLQGTPLEGVQNIQNAYLDKQNSFVDSLNTGMNDHYLEEGRRRAAAGLPSMAQENEGKWGNQFADTLRSGAKVLDEQYVTSDQQGADKLLSNAADQGIVPLLKQVASDPGGAAVSVGPSTVAFLAPAAVAGRTAAALGGSERAMVNASLGASGTTAALSAADQSSQKIMNAPSLWLALNVPEYGELISTGVSDEQAREILAERAYYTALPAAGATNLVTMGLGAKFNPLETLAATGKLPAITGSRAAQALAVPGAESITEFAQGFGEKVAGNQADIATGEKQAGQLFAGAPGAGALEALASAPIAAGASAKDYATDTMAANKQESELANLFKNMATDEAIYAMSPDAAQYEVTEPAPRFDPELGVQGRSQPKAGPSVSVQSQGAPLVSARPVSTAPTVSTSGTPLPLAEPSTVGATTLTKEQRQQQNQAEIAKLPYGALNGKQYTVKDSMFTDEGSGESTSVQIIVHRSGSVAAMKDDGQMVDLTDMAKAGYSPEKMLAVAMGGHKQGETPDETKVSLSTENQNGSGLQTNVEQPVFGTSGATNQVGNGAETDTTAESDLATNNGRQLTQNQPANEAITTRLLDLENKSNTQELTPDEALEYVRLLKEDRVAGKVGGRVMPGIKNSTAYTQASDAGQLKPVQTFLDADNFKRINDELDHNAGDEAIAQIGQALFDELGEGNVFHRSGDEFIVQGDDPAVIDAAMARARERLANIKLQVEMPDGTVRERVGISFSYGTGSNITEAENAQRIDKDNRAAAGLRTDRRAVGSGLDLGTDQAPVTRGQEEGQNSGNPAATESDPYSVTSFFDSLDQEIGWSEIGGRIQRSPEEENAVGGDVIGRSKWVGKIAPDGTESNFWRNRPNPSITQAKARKAIEKYKAGKKLGSSEQEFIDYALRTASEYSNEARFENGANQEVSRLSEKDAGIAEILQEINSADYQEAITLAELADRAEELGATDQQLVGIRFDESAASQARQFYDLIKQLEANRGNDTRTTQETGGSRGESQEAGQGSVSERGQASLIPAATTQEVIAGAGRDKDNKRNGADGRDVPSMAGTPLFAGDIPEQTDLDETDLNDTLGDIDETFEDGNDTDQQDLRRQVKRKFKKNVAPITSKDDGAKLAYSDELFTDNFYTENQIANMPPTQLLAVAKTIVKEKFGFTTVEVAANLNTLEAINQLKFAYSNLESMAALLNWPNDVFGKIAPNLKLLRDAGGALAYLDPSTNTIAITRQNSSYAHEFAHAIDWWTWRMMKDTTNGEPKGQLATGKLKLGGALKDAKVEYAYQNLLHAMYKNDADSAAKIASLEKQILVVLKGIAENKEALAKTNEQSAIGKLEEMIRKKEKHITRISEQISKIKNSPEKQYVADTDYYLNARLIDRRQSGTEAGGNGYWQKPTEMFARAYEAYIAHKMEMAGGGTEFLSRDDAGYLTDSDQFLKQAYPQEADRQRIFDALDFMMTQMHPSLVADTVKEIGQDRGPTQEKRTSGYNAWKESSEKSLLERILENQKETNIARARAKRLELEKAAERKMLRDIRNPNNSRALDVALRGKDAYTTIGAAGLMAMATHLNVMSKKYPRSAALKKIARIFATNPGSGELRAEVYEEFKGIHKNRFVNDLGKITRKHNLNSWSDKETRALRDAIVDHRTDGNRPLYSDKVLAAAKDFRLFHDEIWMFLQNNGINVGYTKNGYLRRIMDEVSIANDPAGFMESASKVYKDVFEKEVGTIDNYDEKQFVQYAKELLDARDPEVIEFTRLVKDRNKVRKKFEEGKATEEDVEAAQADLDAYVFEVMYEKVQDAWAKAAAQDWYNRISGTVATDDFDQQGAEGQFMKSRTLPPSADITLGDYMVTDPIALTSSYLNSVVNKVTFEHFFPPADKNKPDSSVARVNKFRAQMAKEGVLEDDVNDIMKDIEMITGFYRPNITPRGLRTQARLVATMVPVILGRSLMSQLAEPANMGIRTGNVGDVVSIYMNQVKQLAAWLPGVNKLVSRNAKDDLALVNELAEFIGVVTDANFDQIMNNRDNNLYMDKEAGRWLANFYRGTGIQGHTNSMRRAATSQSIKYLKRIAKKHLKGSKAATNDLKDLGIDPMNVDLVKYLANEMPLRPSVHELETNPNSKVIVTAMARMVDESFLNPKMADKPRAASTKEYFLMYGVLSYASSFHRNVTLRLLRRTGKMAKNANTIEGAKELGGELSGVSAAIALQLSLVAMQTLLRAAIFNAGDWDKEMNKWMEDPKYALAVLASRSGFLGLGDPIFNAALGVKYETDLSSILAGPYLSMPLLALQNGIKAAMEDEKNNTNTAEFKAGRGFYNLFVAPVIARAILSRAPVLTPALMYTSSGVMRDAVVEAGLGPIGSKLEEKKKTSDNNQQTRQSGRDSGGRGSSGRESGGR